MPRLVPHNPGEYHIFVFETSCKGDRIAVFKDRTANSESSRTQDLRSKFGSLLGRVLYVSDITLYSIAVETIVKHVVNCLLEDTYRRFDKILTKLWSKHRKTKAKFELSTLRKTLDQLIFCNYLHKCCIIFLFFGVIPL